MHKNLARRCVMLAALMLSIMSSYTAAAEVREPPARRPVGQPLVLAQAEYTADPSRKHYDLQFPNAVLCGAQSSAKVTIAFFGGPQCGITRTYYLEGIEPLWKQNPEKVSIMMAQLPKRGPHPDAEVAARLILAARQHQKSCRMMDALFDLYKSNPGRQVLTSETKRALAAKVGIDLAVLEAETSSDAVTSALKADETYAESIGVKASPTIFVNGRILPTLNLDVLRRMVQEELSK